MDRLVQAAADAGVRATACVVEGGVPADEIVSAAEQAKSDLLVLGTHGRTGVARLVLGSVTNQVLTHSKIPVLVFR